MKSLVARIFRRSRVWFAAAFWTVAFWSHVVLAQNEAGKATENEEKSYVNQYALVILCIALGLVLICKPSGRAERVKKQDD